MTQVIKLDLFRSTGKMEQAVTFDDGQDPQADPNQAAAAPKLELIRSQADSAASVAFESVSAQAEATASTAIVTDDKADAAMPAFRRIAREELQILLWDVEEYYAKWIAAGGSEFPFNYQRSALQPAIDEAQNSCLATRGNVSHADDLLTPEQFAQVEELKAELRKLMFAMSAALRRIRRTG